MNDNPYQPSLVPSPPREFIVNRWALAGFVLNIVALAALLCVGWTPWSWLWMRAAFVCLPGSYCCFVGLFKSPRRLSVVGLIMGFYVAACLPTFYLAMERMQLDVKP